MDVSPGSQLPYIISFWSSLTEPKRLSCSTCQATSWERKNNSSWTTPNNLLKTSCYTTLLFAFTNTCARTQWLTRPHPHTHTPPLQLYGQSKLFLRPEFSVPKPNKSNSRDEWFYMMMQYENMFTFVAALISHKQIVWVRDKHSCHIAAAEYTRWCNGDVMIWWWYNVM